VCEAASFANGKSAARVGQIDEWQLDLEKTVTMEKLGSQFAQVQEKSEI
jgi:hypothetical protein